MTQDKIKRADELGEFVCKLCWYKRWDVIRNNRGLSFVTDPFIEKNLNLRKEEIGIIKMQHMFKIGNR